MPLLMKFFSVVLWELVASYAGSVTSCTVWRGGEHFKALLAFFKRACMSNGYEVCLRASTWGVSSWNTWKMRGWAARAEVLSKWWAMSFCDLNCVLLRHSMVNTTKCFLATQWKAQNENSGVFVLTDFANMLWLVHLWTTVISYWLPSLQLACCQYGSFRHLKECSLSVTILLIVAMCDVVLECMLTY